MNVCVYCDKEKPGWAAYTNLRGNFIHMKCARQMELIQKQQRIKKRQDKKKTQYQTREEKKEKIIIIID